MSAGPLELLRSYRRAIGESGSVSPSRGTDVGRRPEPARLKDADSNIATNLSSLLLPLSGENVSIGSAAAVRWSSEPGGVWQQPVAGRNDHKRHQADGWKESPNETPSLHACQGQHTAWSQTGSSGPAVSGAAEGRISVLSLQRVCAEDKNGGTNSPHKAGVMLFSRLLVSERRTAAISCSSSLRRLQNDLPLVCYFYAESKQSTKRALSIASYSRGTLLTSHTQEDLV